MLLNQKSESPKFGSDSKTQTAQNSFKIPAQNLQQEQNHEHLLLKLELVPLTQKSFKAFPYNAQLSTSFCEEVAMDLKNLGSSPSCVNPNATKAISKDLGNRPSRHRQGGSMPLSFISSLKFFEVLRLIFQQLICVLQKFPIC